MLKQKIHQDSTDALKSGDQFLLGTLRMLLASITNKEKEVRYKEKLNKEPELTDEQIIEVITSEIKKRKDAIALYIQGKRPELAEREQKEIDILKKYLPAQLSEEELKKLVQESIAKTGAKEIHPVKSAEGGAPAEQFNRVKDMGKIMQDLMPKVKGKADSGEVSKIVKELLTK